MLVHLGRSENNSLSAPVHKYGHVFRDAIWFSVAPQPVSSAPFYVILSEATWNGEASRSRQNLRFGNRL